ncbi:MAG: hypothetical protein QM699_12725 [Amaricoccus sp.]|uniref:tetratricopeptide repeat protein n=1 Tax=Amaricoccus sp. TaxID=1872485 RepID=UPI0039E3AF56
MRRLISTSCAAVLLAAVPLAAVPLVAMLAWPAVAEITNTDECKAALAADPAKAREDAAVWERSGGGVPARLCSAAALAATGAHATAAQMLTALAENPNRAMSTGLRVQTLVDAADQWLAAGKPDLARALIDRADTVTPPDAGRLVLAARAAAAEEDWPAAATALRAALTTTPDDALAHALLAAALRNGGDAAAALPEADRAVALAPDLPEAMFEQGAARAETGDAKGASAAWLALIEQHPDSSLAGLARLNLQRLP